MQTLFYKRVKLIPLQKHGLKDFKEEKAIVTNYQGITGFKKKLTNM